MITQPRICVEAARGDLESDAAGAVDVFRALEHQFFWADRVMLAADDGESVLSGEIVAAPER